MVFHKSVQPLSPVWLIPLAKGRVFLCLGLLMVPQLQASQTATGDSDCVVESNAACVNWSTGQAMASGIGLPASWADTDAKKKLSATRAAKLSAAQALLEVLQGINLNSDDELNTRLEKSGSVSSRLKGRLKDLEPVREPEYLKDGSVRVRLATKVHGILPRKWLTTKDTTKASTSQVLPTYSGLIINAQGLKAAPALSPRLLGADGQLVYTAGYVDRQYIISQGAVGYLKSLEAAKKHPRVGDRPLIIKPLAVSGTRRTDFVLSAGDADLLRRLHRRQDFLSQSRVIIVLGEGKK